MYAEDSRKYSFCQSFRTKNLTKGRWSLYHTSDITKFQTLQRIESIPTLSRVFFFCRGINESRDRFKHFMESEPRGKVESLFDITRITWSYRHHTIRSFGMEKSQIFGRFLAYSYSDKVPEKCSSSKTVIWESFMTFRKFVTFVLQRM